MAEIETMDVSALEHDPTTDILTAVENAVGTASFSGKEVVYDDSEEELSENVKYLDYHGVQVPYVPAERKTVWDTQLNAWVVQDVEPIYIAQLKNNRIDVARTSAAKEIMLSLVRELGITAKGYEAPIALSAGVPAGFFALDGHRIIVNEAWALDRALDADGDRAWLIFNKSGEKAALVKYPITKPVPVLERVRGLPKETFYDFTIVDMRNLLNEYPIGFNYKRNEKGELELSEIDEWEEFDKSHMNVPVGLLTSNWNTYELWQTRGWDYADRIKYFMQNPQRFEDIESGGMKAARKAGQAATVADILSFNMRLTNRFSWALTSTGSIGSMTPDRIEWILSPKPNFISELVKDIRMLNIHEDDCFVKTNPPRQTFIPKPKIVDGGFVNRLVQLGVLRFGPNNPDNTKGYRHHRAKDGIPPVVLVYITVPTGQAVALTDTKRNGAQTYAYLLYPVFDPEQGKYVHPINHMAKVLAQFDSRIITRDGTFKGFWPRNPNDLAMYPVKAAQFLKRMQEYCGVYGDAVPADWKENVLSPSKTGLVVAKHTVVIDYLYETDDLDYMRSIAEKANAITRICVAGGKGSDRRVRKYLVAHPNGVAELADARAHPRRSGASRAQLLRAIQSAQFTVAIVTMDTQTGVLITPSGVEKQKTDRGFLPIPHSTEHPDYTQVTEFYTLTGERRKVWLTDPRESIEIGKLIRQDGQKFMPRLFKPAGEQIYLSDGRPVDLIMNHHELLEKQCHHCVLEEAEEGTMRVPYKFYFSDAEIAKREEAGLPRYEVRYREITVMVATITYYRTGSASENIKPRARRMRFKGFDMLPIKAALLEGEILPREEIEKPVRSKFARELSKAINRVTTMVASSSNAG